MDSDFNCCCEHSKQKQLRISLKDIASELGISQTAVSFAINDKPGVSAETKKKVNEAAMKLGWRPVYAAQALGSSRTMTIGFAPTRSYDELKDESFMLHFMAGAQASLSKRRYGLLYQPCSSMKEELATYEDWASRKRVDGVILVNLQDNDPRPARLKELGLFAVLAGGPVDSDWLLSLSIDDSQVMGCILDNLLESGHKRIAYISGDSSLMYSKDRQKSFQMFAAEKNLDKICVEYTGFKPENAARITMDLLNQEDPPTAFIYETEILAIASLKAMTEYLIKRDYEENTLYDHRYYPYKLPAIVSFEDSFICESSYPSITSVQRDASEYGSKVANLLLKVIDGENVKGDRKILTPRLVLRDSTLLYKR